MNQETKPKFSIDVFHLVGLVWKWKWPLGIISVLAALFTYIFTGPAFVQPRYLATVIFYPTTNPSISNSILSEPGENRYTLLEFGSSEDAEQILQILKSEDLKNAVISKFKLAQHYKEVDTTVGASLYTMRMIFDKYYKVKQTEYKAIQVSVLDTDPEMAADMANFIADYAGFLKNHVQKNKANEAVNILEGEYLSQKRLMDSIENTLLQLREKGVYDYFEQSSQLNEAYSINLSRFEQEKAMLKVYEENKESLPDTLLIRSKARIMGYEAALKAIKPKLESLKTYGGIYLDNVNNRELERKKLVSLKTRYESARLDSERSLPQKFIINPASKPEIPSTPRRLLTTGIVLASTFIMAVLIILLMEGFSSIRNKTS